MKKSKIVLYQARTADQLELIIAQFDTIEELAGWAGVDTKTLRKLLKNKKCANVFYFEKVTIYNKKTTIKTNKAFSKH